MDKIWSVLRRIAGASVTVGGFNPSLSDYKVRISTLEDPEGDREVSCWSFLNNNKKTAVKRTGGESRVSGCFGLKLSTSEPSPLLCLLLFHTTCGLTDTKMGLKG